MQNSFTAVTDRALSIKQELGAYSPSSISKDSTTYDGADIGEECIRKKALPAASSEGFGSLMRGLWAQIFGKSGIEMSDSMKNLIAMTEKGGQSSQYSYDAPCHGHSKPAAPPRTEAKPECRPAPMASEKEGKPVQGENRPAGDKRSAEQIINDNPVLKNLGDQKDIQRGKLKDLCGDWTEANKDPKSRADAAWKVAHVLNWVDNSKTAQGKDIKGGKGDISGLTNDGDARHGTKAGLLKDFGDKGYGALKDDQRLDRTKDSHVRKDGTSKDNFQWACGQVGKVLKYVAPFLGNILEGVGESKGGFWGAVKGGLGGAVETWKNCADGFKDAITKGKISPFQIVSSMYKANITDSLKDDGKKEVAEKIEKSPI